MLDTFLKGDAVWFGAPALLATAFFLVRLVLLAVGADHGGGHLGDVHVGDVHAGDAHAGHPGDPHDSASAFRFLSIQSITGFLMGFGWGGLAAHHFTRWPLGMELLTGVCAGAATAWVLGLSMRAMLELQASGNIPLRAAVGREGTVYVGVPGPGAGRGQVKLVVDGRQRIYDAVAGTEPLPTGTRVSVLAANDDNTLTVSRA
jgi:hypothetical protein